MASLSTDEVQSAGGHAGPSLTTVLRNRRLFGDHEISNWKGAGLLFPSLATGSIRTIRHTMIEREIGTMPTPDLEAIDRELRRCLGL